MEGYSRKRRQIERERQANRWIKEIKIEKYKKRNQIIQAGKETKKRIEREKEKKEPPQRERDV